MSDWPDEVKFNLERLWLCRFLRFYPMSSDALMVELAQNRAPQENACKFKYSSKYLNNERIIKRN